MDGTTENDFLLTGISHKTAPVEIRETLSFTEETIPGILCDLHHIDGISECVVLSTCNRTEIYAHITAPFEEVRERIDHYIETGTDNGQDALTHLYHYNGSAVIEHLFNVTSGLDSQILGETQIFGQVKDAYALACDNQCTGPAINRLFHFAFQVGKQIRNETSIGEGITSISSAAVMFVRKIFGNLDGLSVLLIGVGKIGTLCAKQLKDCGIQQLFIANRTYEHAVSLAQNLSGEAVPFEKMGDLFETVDIVITSVISTSPILTRETLAEHVGMRRGKRLSFIDLGVPRNVAPDTSELENVHLFNIDDLEDVTTETRDKRKNEAEKARKIITKAVEDYTSWLRGRDAIPVINDLRDRLEDIRLAELKKVQHRVSPETLDILDQVSRRIVRKILHNPTITVRNSVSGKIRRRLIESITELFIKDKNSGPGDSVT